ncbi:hypothetical protein [Kitasatospora sp. NBC_01302]|uniref:hypothetical protein n=1 Tax=Kitasatospora sp. NBC_01302 TaxID=2903575 RepID=UPI002E10460C|nr:hypothetical protein OG294_05190 [Kitasatospora sp. NBC_01302]
MTDARDRQGWARRVFGGGRRERRALENLDALQGTLATIGMGYRDLVARLLALIDEGRVDEAVQLARKARDSREPAKQAAAEVMSCLMGMAEERYADVLAGADRIVALAGAEAAPEAAYCRGLVHFQLDDQPRAIEQFTLAVTSPVHAIATSAALTLGHLLVAAQDDEAALPLLCTAYEDGRDAERPRAAFELAMLKQRSGAREEARELYCEAVRGGGRELAAEARVRLTALLGELDEQRDAVADAVPAGGSAGVADSLAAVTAMIELADQARTRGDQQEAERLLRTAVGSSVVPYRQLAEVRLGGLLSETGRVPEAVTQWLKAADGPDPQLRRAVADQLGFTPFVDAGFLVHADPAIVLPLLPGAWGAGRLGAAVYQASAERHRTAGPAVRRQLLELDATRYGSPELAARIAAVPVPDEPPAHWQVGGSSGSQLGGFRWTATGHEEGVRSIAVTAPDDRPVAVTGGGDGTVRLWDLATGAPIGEPMTGHTGMVLAVAAGESAGRPVAISGGSDEAVRIWDLTTHQLLHQPLTGHRDWVTGLAMAEVRRRPVVVSCGDDRTVRVWDLATGAPVGEPLYDRSGPGSPLGGRLRAVATTELGRRTIAVTGDNDGVVRAWDLTKGRQLASPVARVAGSVEALSIVVAGARPTVVVSTFGGVTTLWDLATGAPVGESLSGDDTSTRAVATAEVGNRHLVVTGNVNGMLRLWDPNTGEETARCFAGPEGVAAVATSVVDGQPVAIVGCGDGTVRRWDLTGTPPPGAPRPGHGDSVNALAIAAPDGVADANPFVVSVSSDGTARLWDLVTGAAVGEPFGGHHDLVYGAATAVLDDRPVVVTGGRDRKVRIWDPGTGAQVGEPLEHDTGVAAVATALLDGRPIVVTGSWGGTVEAWDLATRQPLYEPLTGHESHVDTLAVAVADGRPVVVSGSIDGTARIWDLATGAAIGAPLQGGGAADEGDEDDEDLPTVAGVATVQLDGRPVAVTGTTDGLLQVWDLATAAPLGEPVTVAEDWLTALTAGVLDGRPVLVAGGEDGTVRSWDLATRARLRPDLVLPLGIEALAVAPDGRLAVGFGWEVAVFGPPPRSSGSD